MTTSESTKEVGVVSDAEARKEAARLLADATFHVSDRHRAFLSYIFDAFFEGRSDSVKAYTIAVDVFNRPTTFDASADPIVRIEATRLREALDKYYETLTNLVPIRLEIPRGRYVPSFSRRCFVTPEAESALSLEMQRQPDVELAATESEMKVEPRRSRRTIAVALAAGALCFTVASVVGGLASLSSTTTNTGRPVLELMITDTGENKTGSAEFMNQLALALGHFGSVRTRLESKAVAAAKLSQDERDGAYRLSVRYSASASTISLWWQVTDKTTDEALWTGDESLQVNNGNDNEAFRTLSYRLSRRIAGSFGVINTVELNRKLPPGSLGNICIQRGDIAVERRDMAGVLASLPCLEETVAQAPNDAEALASLARVVGWAGRTKGDASMTARSLELANQAAMKAPQSATAARAQMATQYLAGQPDTAIAAGRRGVSLNPENAELTAKLATILFLTGHSEEGRRLAIQSSEQAGETLRDTSFVLIFDAYHRGEYKNAIRLARQVSATDTPTAVLHLASVAKLEDKAAIEKEVASARVQHKDIDQVAANMMSGTRYDKALETSLRSGLEQAGLIPAL